jgi:hypothetical protein
MTTRLDSRPNYSLRISILALALSMVALVIIIATPASILDSWQYWAAFGGLVLSLWIIFRFQSLPDPGKKRKKIYTTRGFGPKGTALLALFIAGFVVLNGIDRSTGTIVTYSVVPGIMAGIVSISTWSFLVKGKNRYCQHCGEYRWFRPKRGSVYCTSCGTEFQDTTPPERAARLLPGKLEPTTGRRITMERLEIPPLGVNPPKCKICRSQLQLTTLKAFSGKAGRVEISFFNMPCFACPHDHLKKYPGTDFGMYLIEELNNLPQLKAKGRLNAELVCPNCNSTFDILEQKSTFGLQLKFDALNSFLVDVSLPGTACPTCLNRFALLDPQMASDLADAVISAFKSISMER